MKLTTMYAIIDSRKPLGSGRGNRAYNDKAYAERVLYRALRRYVGEGWGPIASAYYSVRPITIAAR